MPILKNKEGLVCLLNMRWCERLEDTMLDLESLISEYFPTRLFQAFNATVILESCFKSFIALHEFKILVSLRALNCAGPLKQL